MNRRVSADMTAVMTNATMPKEDDKMTPGTAALLLLVASLLVLVVVYVADMAIFAPRRLSRQTDTWTEVPCTISKIEVEVVEFKATKSKGVAFGTSSVAYAPRVEYSYMWQGNRYNSKRFWFGTSLWNSKSDVEAIFASYDVKQPSMCFVNPADPAQAVLTKDVFERPIANGNYLVAFVGTSVATVVAILVGFFILRRRVVGSTADPTGSSTHGNTRMASNGYVLRAWILSFIWNGLLLGLAYLAWVGGAPMSFFVCFLGLFWLIGLLIVAISIYCTIDRIIGRPVTKPQT